MAAAFDGPADEAGAFAFERAVTSSLHFWRKDSSSASVFGAGGVCVGRSMVCVVVGTGGWAVVGSG